MPKESSIDQKCADLEETVKCEVSIREAVSSRRDSLASSPPRRDTFVFSRILAWQPNSEGGENGWMRQNLAMSSDSNQLSRYCFDPNFGNTKMV